MGKEEKKKTVSYSKQTKDGYSRLSSTHNPKTCPSLHLPSLPSLNSVLNFNTFSSLPLLRPPLLVSRQLSVSPLPVDSIPPLDSLHPMLLRSLLLPTSSFTPLSPMKPNSSPSSPFHPSTPVHQQSSTLNLSLDELTVELEGRTKLLRSNERLRGARELSLSHPVRPV